MLLCRLYDDQSKAIVAGSCNIAYYDKGGWFPIESFDYGIPSKDKSTDKGAGNNNQGGGNANRPPGGGGARPGTPPPASGQQKGSADPDKSEVAISKPVDTGTCDLMVLAMRDREETVGAKSKVQADIHLLSIVDAVGSRWSYPSLMIYLGGVLVKDWKVSASGDERATESLNLQYTRSAMQYVSTKDAKEFKYFGGKGWDQNACKQISWDFHQFMDHLADLREGK